MTTQADILFALRVIDSAPPRFFTTNRKRGILRELREQSIAWNPLLKVRTREEMAELAKNEAIRLEFAEEHERLEALIAGFSSLSSRERKLRRTKEAHVGGFLISARRLMEVPGSEGWPLPHKMGAMAVALGWWLNQLFVHYNAAVYPDIKDRHPDVARFFGEPKLSDRYPGPDDVVRAVREILLEFPEALEEWRRGRVIREVSRKLRGGEQAWVDTKFRDPVFLQAVGEEDPLAADLIGYANSPRTKGDFFLSRELFKRKVLEARDRGITGYYQIMRHMGEGRHMYPGIEAAKKYRWLHVGFSIEEPELALYVGRPREPWMISADLEKIDEDDLIRMVTEAFKFNGARLWKSRREMRYDRKALIVAALLGMNQQHVETQLKDPAFIQRIGEKDPVVADFIGYPDDLPAGDPLEVITKTLFAVRAMEMRDRGEKNYYRIMQHIGMGRPFAALHASAFYRAHYDAFASNRIGTHIGKTPVPTFA